MSKSSTVEIVIPILNEEATLDQQIRKLMAEIRHEKYNSYQILITIADNGSSDKSQEISQNLCNEFTGIKYLHITEKGVGRALKQAWEVSNADLVGFMDLDLSTHVKHLIEALDCLQGDQIGIVCGSRNQKNSKVINRKFIRTITSKVLNYILKKSFNAKFTDGMCGFKFLKRKHFQEIIDAAIGFDDWFFSAEILVIAEYLSITIVDMPVYWEDNRESKVKIINLSKRFIIDIYKLRKHLIKNKENNLLNQGLDGK